MAFHLKRSVFLFCLFISCLHFKLFIFVFRVVLIEILSLLFCCFISRIDFCVVVTGVVGACVLPALAWFCFMHLVVCHADEGAPGLMQVSQMLPIEVCTRLYASGSYFILCVHDLILFLLSFYLPSRLCFL